LVAICVIGRIAFPPEVENNIYQAVHVDFAH
jgi:hypothetical protein